MWIFFLGLSLLQSDPYVLVLQNDKRMQIKQAPVCDRGRCTLILLNGQKTSLPESFINVQATENANRLLSEQRTAEAKAKAEAEAEAAAKPKEPETKPEPIRLERRESLPEYDDSRNRSTSNTAGEATDGAPTAGDPIEPPRVRTFDPEGDVFIQRETITRYQDHTIIDIQMSTILVEGAQDVEVSLRINFDGGPVTLTGKAARLNYRAPTVISFRAEDGGEVLRTFYDVAYKSEE